MTIEINAAFPIEWGKEYYTVEKTVKEKRAPCECCDDTGKVTIRGAEYTCPACFGEWSHRPVVGWKSVYSVWKWSIASIFVTANDIRIKFKRLNGKSEYDETEEISKKDFTDMIMRARKREKKFYDDYQTAMEEVRRLNAEARAEEDAK